MLHHVLLDADGVVQRVGGEGWRSLITRHLGDRSDDFVSAVGELEAPALRGTGEFPEGLDGILADFGVIADAEEFYAGLWLVIEPLQQTLDLANSLREARLGVHLVTNQHARRASYMKRVLGYDDLFDTCFYSCDIGVAKPDPAFFVLVCEQLDAAPDELLLVDDSDANVAAARTCGLHAIRWHHDQGKDELDRLLATRGL